MAAPVRQSDSFSKQQDQIVDLLGADFYEGIDYELRPTGLSKVFRQLQEEQQNSREFTPVSGEKNVWTIQLPELLLTQVRGNLEQREKENQD